MKKPLGKIAAAFLVLVSAARTATQAQAQAPTFTTLHSFDGTDGAAPTSPLVQGTDGNFYGITSFGGTTAGTVFKTTPTGTLTTLHIFNFTEGFFSENATLSQSALVQATDGNFYGTAPLGGANGQGTVFKITPSGTLTMLYSFCSQTNCTDGAGPLAGVVQATNGNFYGTTYYGGAVFGTTCFQPGCGTVFEITPTGTLTTLYSFCTLSVGCPDGLFPRGGLIQAADGNFYGTTLLSSCGPFGCGGGTVFKITPSGTLTTLHSFGSQSGDGRDPAAALVQATDGNFYGTTSSGGANNAGTVFKITPSGTLTTLYSFCSQSGCTDGVGPDAGLFQATDGNFYGTTVCGGRSATLSSPYCSSGGTIFKITPSGTLTTLYSFCSQTNCTDGLNPVAGLVQGTDGNFYGTTQLGGANGLFGTVFSLSVGLVPSAPTITSIAPTSVIAGGTAFTLTVNGTNFVSGSTVNFNGVALATTFVSSTQLTAVVPASDFTVAGGFTVTVTNPGGTMSNAVSFTVVSPQDAMGAIINSVNALLFQGVINGGQDNSLLVQLQHAITMMNAGKNAGAIGNLDSFISEVNDLLSSGVLSPSQASSLTSAAQSVIAAL